MIIQKITLQSHEQAKDYAEHRGYFDECTEQSRRVCTPGYSAMCGCGETPVVSFESGGHERIDIAICEQCGDEY